MSFGTYRKHPDAKLKNSYEYYKPSFKRVFPYFFDLKHQKQPKKLKPSKLDLNKIKEYILKDSIFSAERYAFYISLFGGNSIFHKSQIELIDDLEIQQRLESQFLDF